MLSKVQELEVDGDIAHVKPSTLTTESSGARCASRNAAARASSSASGTGARAAVHAQQRTLLALEKRSQTTDVLVWL